jgi:hypothetical protein
MPSSTNPAQSGIGNNAGSCRIVPDTVAAAAKNISVANEISTTTTTTGTTTRMMMSSTSSSSGSNRGNPNV